MAIGLPVAFYPVVVLASGYTKELTNILFTVICLRDNKFSVFNELIPNFLFAAAISQISP